jgi:hypothetical protein
VRKNCPDSADGRHGLTDTAGKCPWCDRKVEAALPPPRKMPTSRLTEEYRRHYDPDHGSGKDDT